MEKTADRLKKLYEEYIEKVKQSNKDYDFQFVFSDGLMRKGIMLIGEAPGKDEVAQGKPFVGMAGAKLKEFMESLKLERDDILVTNAVKYRPYKINPKSGKKSNRTPTKKEIQLSLYCLEKEIEIIKPKLILTLGNVPLRALKKDFTLNIGQWHGRQTEYKGITHFPLYHPASVIYNKSLQSVFEQDLEVVRQYILLHFLLYFVMPGYM